MAERTISIYPISKATTLQQIQQEFAQYSLQKIGLVVQKSTGYIQFAKVSQIEALSSKYPQCKVPNLSDAEIGFVQPQFKWPVSKTTAKAQTLVLIKNCDKILQIPQEKIRQIFKQFGIERIVKFDNTKEIVLQFYSQDELQLLELNFDDLKVPQLGPNAQIDVESQFPVQRFIQKYLELNQVHLVQHSQKKEVKSNTSPIKEKVEAPLNLSQEKRIENYIKSKEEQKTRKEEQNKRKMEQIEREILQKEKARQSAIQKFQRERKEQEEKARIQRDLKQKKEKQRLQRERIQKQARENKQREQRQRREKEERQKRQLKQRQQREKAEELRLKQVEAKILKDQRQQKLRKQRQRKKEQELQYKLLERIKDKQEEKKLIKQQFHEKVQEERQLEQILAQQKQRINKKQINLPQIIKTNLQSNKEVPQKAQEYQSKFAKVKKPLTVGDYKDISVHFITFIAVAWIYYLWIS